MLYIRTANNNVVEVSHKPMLCLHGGPAIIGVKCDQHGNTAKPSANGFYKYDVYKVCGRCHKILDERHAMLNINDDKERLQVLDSLRSNKK